jgi:hypothetical protein
MTSSNCSPAYRKENRTPVGFTLKEQDLEFISRQAVPSNRVIRDMKGGKLGKKSHIL